MAKSTETELSELHGVVAKVLSSQLSETITITNEAGDAEEVMTASPATISAAIKFLKDNDITSSIEDDTNLGDLRDQLEKKQNKRGLRLVPVTEEVG